MARRLGGGSNFDLQDELFVSTDTMYALNRRLEGVFVNDMRGFVFGAGSELQIIVNRFFMGGDVGAGAFDTLMPWVLYPVLNEDDEAGLKFPLILASAQ